MSEEREPWGVVLTSTAAGGRPMRVELTLTRSEGSFTAILGEEEARELYEGLASVFAADDLMRLPDAAFSET